MIQAGWTKRLTELVGTEANRLDNEFGCGGSWYRSLVEKLIADAKKRNATNNTQYWMGVCSASEIVRDLVTPQEVAAKVEPHQFVHEFARLRHADAQIYSQVESILKIGVNTVLPPQVGAPEGVRCGVSLPLRTPLFDRQGYVDNVRVVVRNSGAREVRFPYVVKPLALPQPILEVDFTARKVLYKESPASTRHAADLGTETTADSHWSSTIDNINSEVVYDAAHFQKGRVDLFGTGSPTRADVTAYRLSSQMDPAIASGIVEGYRRYSMGIDDGIVGRGAYELAAQAATSAYQAADDSTQAGVRALFDAVRSMQDQPEPVPIIKVALADLEADLKPPLARESHTRPGPEQPIPAGRPTDILEKRTLDVQMSGSIEEREVTVFACLSLDIEQAPESFRSEPFEVDTSKFVTINASAQGFVTSDKTWVEVSLVPGEQSGTVAFRYALIDSSRHQITVVARQNGQELGRVDIDDFNALCGRRRSARLCQSEHPWDVLVKIDDDGAVRVTTQDGLHRGDPLEKSLPHSSSARDDLDKAAKKLVRSDLDDRQIDTRLRRVGQSIASSLPASLCQLLASQSGKWVLIEHPPTLDFPFELALLSTPDGDAFLGELHNVTRWLSPAEYGPRSEAGIARRAAFVWDSAALEGVEAGRLNHHERLAALCPTEGYSDFDTLSEDVLQTDKFNLIDIVTHMESKASAAGLVIGGEALRPSELLREEQTFGSSAAVVFLNACSSAQGDLRFFEQRTFPERLIGLNVQAVVASTLPVEPELALRFGELFYEALASGRPLGEATRNARIALQEDGSTTKNRGRRRLATAAYCVFGHPRMTVIFPDRGGVAT